MSAPETKTCPECAEQVRVAARVCRFCGHRFDAPPRSGNARLLDLLLRRSARRDLSLPELLAEWGIELAEGEDVAAFQLAEVDGRDAYVLVTDRRVAVLRSPDMALLAGWAREAVAAEATGRRGRDVRLRAAGAEVTVRRLPRGAGAELVDALASS